VNANAGNQRRVLLPRARRRQSSGSWTGRAGAALLLVSIALCASASIAAASSSDAQATHAYLAAQYKLAGALLHEGTATRDAENATAAQIARECPGVLAGIPQPSQLFPAPMPRATGENARLAHQQQTIEAELATALASAGDSLYTRAAEAYVAEVGQLSWSDPTIASLIQSASAAELEEVSTAAPSFCADARAWTQSDYRELSAASRGFEALQAARKGSTTLREERSLGSLLKPYENASDRVLIRKTGALKAKHLAGVRAALDRFLHLGRILGLPRSETEEPPVQTVLGRGRTAAGTRFEVTSGTSGLLGVTSSCRRAAVVEYSLLGGPPEQLIAGVPNNPICLSSRDERHPALFCEAGAETIQTAVPASVVSVRLVLVDGVTIESRVIHVPRAGGGPAGIYVQQIRGSSSHAVSLVELNAAGDIVLALGLPRYRCVKPHTQPELLTSAELATGHTPQGEAFTISAFGSLGGAPFLSVDTGAASYLNKIKVGPGATKAFRWSLSIGCAPHPFVILYGILKPPGESAAAATTQGSVALNVLRIEPRLHAKGQLAYGVFNELPSELTVLEANGSTVYTENLQAQVTETAQFCEGYAEP
jgi:hypothetical protein